MIRVLVLVEGQTEETFVRNVLAPYLSDKGVYLAVTVVTTKRVKSGSDFKGGVRHYAKLRRDTLHLLRDTGATMITTMLDYYGFPADFPDKSLLQGQTPYQRVTALEQAFASNINHRRFLPFLTLHEFEALLFSQPDTILSAIPNLKARERTQFEEAVCTYPAPEEINEGNETHPSKRIIRYIKNYRKVLHGTMIADRIGLAEIRSKCPHFDNWVSHLENLNTSPA